MKDNVEMLHKRDFDKFQQNRFRITIVCLTAKKEDQYGSEDQYL